MVGRIGRPHGVRGEVTVLLESDDPAAFAPGADLQTDGGRHLTVVGSSPYRDRGRIVHFAGIIDRGEAEALRGAIVTMAAGARRILGEGEFWADDLIGLRAIAPSGDTLGEVTGVDFGVGQDRLTITTPDGRAVLVPFVSELVGDPVGGTIEIRDPGGLFPG